MARIAWLLTRPGPLLLLTGVLTRVRPLAKLWFAVVRFNRRVTVLCIARDDADLISVANRYYQRLGIGLRVFLDDRSDELTMARLRGLGIDFEILPSEGAIDSVEALVGPAGERIETEWLLRMDNDELLNPHALVEASLRTFSKDSDCFGIRRSWVLLSDGRPYVGDSDFLGPDWQWRLVRHHRVRFHGHLHTPGFEVPVGRNPTFNPRSRIYHFDWLLRSEAYRRRKVEMYVSELPERPETREELIRYYLPEDTIEELRLTPITESGAEDAVSELIDLGQLA